MSELDRAANPTIEEAIKYLEGMIFTQDFSPSTLRAKAVNTMAIAALREQAERVLCAKCKHYNKTGCSAGFGWCENMDRGTHDEFYCASGKRLEVEHE
jgi:hypothetical protein